MGSGITGMYEGLLPRYSNLARCYKGHIKDFEHDRTAGTQHHLDIFWCHATSVSQDIGTCTKLHCYIVSIVVKSSERRQYIYTKTSLERPCYANFRMIETVNHSWTTRRWSWLRQISSKPPHQYHLYWLGYLPPVRDGDYPIVPNIISAKKKKWEYD